MQERGSDDDILQGEDRGDIWRREAGCEEEGTGLRGWEDYRGGRDMEEGEEGEEGDQGMRERYRHQGRQASQ